MEGIPEEYLKLRGNSLYNYVESSLDLHFSKMEWSDEDIILDVGCGPGKMTKKIVLPKCPKLKKIVAIDIDENYIEYAKKTWVDERIEYKVQDIVERFGPDENIKYDKVVSFFVFHFIPDYQKLFSVISSILKPGGYFCFVIITKYPQWPMLRDLISDPEWTKYLKSEDFLGTIPPTADWKDSEAEFKNLVSNFGLRVIQSKCDDFDMLFSDEKETIDFHLTVVPAKLFKNVEPEIKQRLWKMAGPVFLKYCSKKENGQIAVPYEFLYVSGVKTI